MMIAYCPTDMMIGDFMTKPLQGAKFEKFCDDILGNKPIETVHLSKIGDRSMLDRQTDR